MDVFLVKTDIVVSNNKVNCSAWMFFFAITFQLTLDYYFGKVQKTERNWIGIGNPRLCYRLRVLFALQKCEFYVVFNKNFIIIIIRLNVNAEDTKYMFMSGQYNSERHHKLTGAIKLFEEERNLNLKKRM